MWLILLGTHHSATLLNLPLSRFTGWAEAEAEFLPRASMCLPRRSCPCARLYPQRAQLPIGTPGWPQGDQGHRSGKPCREPAALHTSGPPGLYKWRSMYLQREHGHPVAHVATDYMALNREHPALALHAGLALVAGGTVAVTGSGCPGHWLRIRSPVPPRRRSAWTSAN